MAALAILGVAGSFVGPVVEVVKWVSAPVRRQFNYLCCFHSNINDLRGEAASLDDETRGLQMKVDAATNNAHLILPPVETWLRNSDVMKIEINGILDEAPNVGNGCLKLRQRYSLSKKAKKATPVIKELVTKCKFTEVSHPPPPAAATAPVQSGTTTAYEFESRKEIEDEIMETFQSKNVNVIGLCGMGGLGKTTMAKKIMARARMEGLFGEVVMAAVSQTVDKLNIQLQIAEPLGLKFDGETLIPRASMLRERLRGKKKTLLVFDDIWGSIDMEELGIPCEDGCKVLITSRNSGVLRAMDVEKVCQLRILDENEAWILFKGKAGMCVDGAILNPIAKDVMKECKGLPLALATVGIALKDENEVSIWEDALGQLRRSNPSDIPSVIEQVYNPLKLSYDRLDNQNAKSLFLLCCLFAEDHDIPLEHLTYFATGLHLFEDIGELKEVRGRTSALVKMLKTRGLFLDGSDEDHVRMHDIARDVSVFIASKEGRVKCSSCTWISSHVGGGARRDPPLPESYFPKLKLLWMNNKVEQEMEINDNLIGRSTELNVLFIERGLMKSLPMHTTQALKKSLTTLILLRCESLESVAAVGELKSLEILICRDCHSIKELPEQVRGLKRLKLLEILGCINLERVAGGVISSMVGLEKLKIVDSFENWKGGEIHEEGSEACLREIELLKKLRYLEVGVSDIALVALPLRLPSKLVQFCVLFGACYSDSYAQAKESKYEKTMCLEIEDEAYNINWGDLSTNVFLSRTEYLRACGQDTDFELNLASAQGIRWLTLVAFTNKKNIVSAAAAFPLLHGLSLGSLPNLEEVWDDDGPILSNSFTNLEHLKLIKLRALKRMGKCVLSTAKNFFLQLETIKIRACKEMEHLLVLVPTEEEREKKDGITLSFPKLELVELKNVPKLSSMICSSERIESIQFPVLAHFKIAYCEKLKCFVSEEDDEHCEDDDDSLHLLCHPKVSFGGLKKLVLIGKMESKNVWCDQIPIDLFTGLVHLRIQSYTKTRRLFSSSKIPQNLVNLKELIIVSCPEMVSVIEDEEVSSSCDHTTEHTVLFPSLQYLSLIDLPKLESFCEGRCALNLSSLKILDINMCHEMKSFVSAPKCHEMKSFVSAPALQTVRIDSKILKPVNDDLNVVLHQHFEKAKMFWIADCRGMKSFNAAAGSLVITPALQIVTIDSEDLEFADDLNATLYQHFEKAN